MPLYSPLRAFALLFLIVTASAARADTANLTGTITDGRSGQPLSGVQVLVGTASLGQFTPLPGRSPLITDSAGRYYFSGLDTQTALVLKALPPAPLTARFWPNLVCLDNAPNCFCPTLGNIALTGGATFTADLALYSNGSLSGRVVRDGDFVALPGTSVTAQFRGSDNAFVHVSVASDANGNFQIGGLPPGDYRVTADAGSDYVAELFDNIPCATTCSSGSAGETPVVVKSDENRAGVNFRLSGGGAISGRLREVGGAPLKFDMIVRLWRVTGSLISVAGEAEVPHLGSGAFAFAGLSPGSYVVSTASLVSAANQQYVNQLNGPVACASDDCQPAEILAAPKIVLSGTQAVDAVNFDLAPAGSISGCVTRLQTGTAMPDVTVALWHDGFGFGVVEDGNQITDANGCFRFDYLHSGSGTGSAYHLRTVNRQGYTDQVYNLIDCANAGCAYASAANLNVPFDADLTQRNFQLNAGFNFSGTVVEFFGGRGIDHAGLHLFDGSGQQVRGPDDAFLYSGSDGRFTTYGLTPGTYYLSYDRVVDGVGTRCVYGGACQVGTTGPAPLSGTPLVISNGSTANLVLPLNPLVLFGNDFE